MVACSQSGGPDITPAIESITADRLIDHIKRPLLRRVRGPPAGNARRGIDGPTISTAQFKELGLEPGNPDGTCIQEGASRRT